MMSIVSDYKSFYFYCLIVALTHIIVFIKSEDNVKIYNENCYVSADGDEICSNNIHNPSSNCIDLHEDCTTWASSGKCTSRERDGLEYMKINCKLSCGACVQFIPNITAMEAIAAYGLAQEISGDRAAKIMEVIEFSIAYMKNVMEQLSDGVENRCRNKNKKCSLYAAFDMCQTDQEFMSIDCGPSCKTCDLINKIDVIQEEADDEFMGEDLSDLLEDLQKDIAIHQDSEQVSELHLSSNDVLLLKGIKKYGIAQEVEDPNKSASTLKAVTKSLLFMEGLDVEEAKTCTNNYALCAYWAGTYECHSNQTFMRKECGPSCQSCGNEDDDEDDDDELAVLFKDLRNDVAIQNDSEQVSNRDLSPNEILLLRGIKKYGIPQSVEGLDKSTTTMDVIATSLLYMADIDELAKTCTNNYELCAYWSGSGECESNPTFMRTECGPSCQNCYEKNPVDENKLAQLLEELVLEDEKNDSSDDDSDLSPTNTLLLNAVEKYGVPQVLWEDDEQFGATMDVITSTILYMRELNDVDLSKKCRNLDESCSTMAVDGACMDNYQYMYEKCAPSCHACNNAVGSEDDEETEDE